MAWCKLCCKDGGRRSRPLCKHVAKATTKQSRKVCRCSGVTGQGDSNIPHRYGSRFGKFGICEHHPEHSVRMYAIMDEPVRVAGRSRR
jgi:hypothetical protein